MLQPRSGCASVTMTGARNFFNARWGVYACALLLLTTLVTCQDTNTDVISRIKKENVPENRDLTVLLVNDQQRNEYNTKIGRFQNVKPLIGLLTSTARTFIQDGVTTEFATQILGTTLDNGRIYAQLLTKSSLVLYSKPSRVEDDVFVKPTRVHSAFDGEWNVKQDLGFIDPDKFALKNTDYLAPSKMEIVYASKPAHDNIKYWNTPTSPDNVENQIVEEPTGRRVQQYNEIPRFNQNNDALNYLDAPTIEKDNKVDLSIEPSILDNVNTLHRHSKAYESNKNGNYLDSKVKEDKFNDSNIVKVKPNFDLPTFTIKNEFSPIFYYIDNVETRSSQQVVDQTKLPNKKFFGQKSEPRPKKTFTYEGFADFTTVVGDTVIIFTPNTEISRPQSPDEVNIFPPAKRTNKFATKVTHLAAEIPVATSTYKAYEAKKTTKLPQPSKEENRSEKALYNDKDRLKNVLYEVDKMPDSISVQYNNGFDLNLDVIQPSEAAVTTTESTRFTDDLGVIGIKNINSVATEPLVTLQPSATVTKNPDPSSIADEDVADMFNTSDEEDDNNASVVTDEDDDITTEMESEIKTTTESGHSEESEEIEVTTENSQDSDDVVCTQGLEIQSTMTTAYRTLTYLTTYFIPLEKSETTTSIKSDVVVESTVGYLTNVACKTNFDIKPTAVVSVEVKSSVHSNVEKPEMTSEKAIAKTPPTAEKNTEDTQTTTEQQKETTPQESLTPPSTEQARIEENKKESTSTTTSTTTERVEISTSTEKSTTPNPQTTPNDSNEETSEENEIDLIYKTLYTTYTYFTTFFGDQTSSIASHKSVVTNIITSTIDLSKLDPKLLGAFDEDEIAPTSVGIGRPTESFAINSIIDLVKNKDVIESVEGGESYSSQTPTPTLDDDLVTSIKPDAVKTYFTTYTFFTTIYVGSDANVCSRNEVYTNYVGPEELIPTKTNLAVNTKANFDFRNCKQIKNAYPPSNPEENSSMESSVSMEEDKDRLEEDSKEGVSPQPSPLEVDMLFSIESNPLNEGLIQTDVKSSSSKGERQYLENNNILDDQISSESNIDEIMPSPTLLLQTSYTTFTYFTTMYIGKDSSKVKSRLETITNVVTETIMPKKIVEEESNLPITYYTTFTYWTTLYKDKSTTITSREEIVSNVVTPTPTVLAVPTISPIDTTPIDIIDSELPPKDLEVELKPSLINDGLENNDDGKATFFTTYTYFTTFYAGNTSQIRSSLETVTNIVDNTKVVEDNQLGRKVPSGAADKNLIQDKDEKLGIAPSVVKENIVPTKLPDLSSGSPTVILGTYIDNLFAEVKQGDNTTPPTQGEKKILFSQVAVISGNSTYVTSDNKTIETQNNISSVPTDNSLVSSTPEVIQSSEPESTTEAKSETEEEDDGSSRKKSRLTFTSRKPSFTPVIIPFASRNRPTFSPKARVPGALGSATTITRADFTPTITATPTLKSVRPSGFGGNRKASAFPGSSAPGRRFTGRSSSVNPSGNVSSPSRASGFGRGSISPSSKRTGFRSSSIRNNNLDLASRSAVPRIRPTASLRLRGGRQSASVSSPPQDQNESETSVTQQEENLTEFSEEITEAPVKTTSNPINRFRRPPLGRQPGTAIAPRSTTTSAPRKPPATRGRLTTTTRRPTTRATTNPLLSLRRQRPNALFPKRNLFKQPDPEPEEEVQKEEQKVENEETLEEEEFEEDNDYESSDRKEQQVSTPTTPAPRKTPNAVQIRPFAFRRRIKRQVDYGTRKFSNFRRPSNRATTRRPEPEPETDPPAPVTQRSSRNRYSSRLSANSRTTTASSSPKSSARQPFIIRGESRTTTSSTPAFRRPKSRPSSRTTTSATRPKAPRLSSKNTHTPSRASPRSSGRSRTSGRTTTSRNRQRTSFENYSGERYNNVLDDGKYTVTYQIPTEVTIPVVNGKITEYKSVISASPSVQTILQNQVSTSIGPLGNQQLVLLSEATELGDNGATKLIRFLIHETPTTTVVFTPTTIRGRKTSYSHIIPSTVYNIEPVTQTVAPEINANVPLANLLLSQLLLGNQQPQLNPLLALQGQGLLPQQPVVQTPVTEYKTRATTYVTTITDARETVLTITFRATPIETTIKDPTIKVITATEYITDTLVTTPTVLAQQQPQFNSLLLQQLLQQQQQQQAIQSIPLQTAHPLLGLGQPDLNLLQSNTISDSPKPNILSDLNTNEDFSYENQEQDENDDEPPPPPKKIRNKPRPAKPVAPKITSVVTLYVSGRYPGEFSTVLSTVVADDTQNVRKREAIYFEDVQIQPSLLPSLTELIGSQDEDIITELTNNNVVDSQLKTESLETIVGDLNKHIRYDASPTPVVKLARPSIVRNTKVNLDEVS